MRLNKIAKAKGVKANLLAKLEFFNPTSSVKDRIGVSMIAGHGGGGHDRAGPQYAGRTDVRQYRNRLGFVAAARGYKLTLVMPESMSIERRKMLSLLGADLVLTPASHGMKGAIAKAYEIVARDAERSDAATIRKPGQSSDPPPHNG